MRVSPACRTPTCGCAIAAAMLERVRDCWASLYSVTSISYRRGTAFRKSGVAMAVVVQIMVDARRRRGDVHPQPD